MIPTDAVAVRVREVFEYTRKDEDGKATPAHVIVLQKQDAEAYALIWIAAAEAYSIYNGLNQVIPPRPLSHDVMSALLKTLKGKLKSVTIHVAEDSIYYSSIHVTANGISEYIDSRPSDAIALALRVEAPIYVAPVILRQTTMDELRQQFQQG